MSRCVMFPGVFRICVVVLLIGTLGLCCWEQGDSDPVELRRYPALLSAAGDAVSEIRGLLKHPNVPRLEGTPLQATLESVGDDAPLALLRVVTERLRENPVRVFDASLGPFAEHDSPLMTWLSARRDENLNPVLTKMLDRSEPDLLLRTYAIQALCWPGNGVAIGPLVRIALDDTEPREIRKVALLHLPDIGLPLPKELRSLFTSRFDYLAAWALAMTGDASGLLIVKDAKVMVGDDPWSLNVLDEVPSVPSGGSESSDSFPTAEDVFSAPEDELEIGPSVLALLDVEPEVRFACLAKIERLARGVELRIGGSADPSRIIDAMNIVLLPPGPGPGPSGFLPEVLAGWEGTCLGRVSLYLAVADRLGLPFRAVAAPSHVFVRWMGQMSRNLELTEGGREHPDAWFLELAPDRCVSVESVEAGVYLRVLSRREFLSYVLVNKAEALGVMQQYETAIRCYKRAIALHPANVPALCGLAGITFESGPGGENVALAGIEAALNLDPVNMRALRLREEIEHAIDRREAALATCDRMLEIAPTDTDARLRQVSLLGELGRISEATSALNELDTEGVVDLQRVHCLRAVLMARSGADWKGYLRRLHLGLDAESTILTGLAEALLVPRGSSSDARRVLAILEEVRSREPRWNLVCARALVLVGEQAKARSLFESIRTALGDTREVRALAMSLGR